LEFLRRFDVVPESHDWYSVRTGFHMSTWRKIKSPKKNYNLTERSKKHLNQKNSQYLKMDGAQYGWRMQKIDHSHGPPADYRNLRNPLPHPPKGMEWHHNPETKEWTIEPVVQSEDSKEAGLVSEIYIEHTVLPTDTLQGLCLKYKITPTKLRQINGFSGSNLHLAPAVLKIPK